MRNILDRLLNGSERPAHAKIVRGMWYTLFIGVVAVLALFIGLSFTDLPSVAQLENPKSEEATQIYGSNGEVIGRLYTENRVPVTFAQLSPNLVNALIATEDERYRKHSGIDFRALARAVVKTGLMGQSSSGGASTLTQQLAKQLFTGSAAETDNIAERVIQKLKEWIIAVRLERKYTKEEILQMYLNKVEFLYGAYGIKAASEIYFNTSQDSLQLHEAAMLVGMLKNPTQYNPLRNQELAMQRRNVVFMQMLRNDKITQEQFDSLKMVPLGAKYTRKTHIDGIATYFRMETAKDVKNILNRPENRKTDGSKYNVYTDGLKVYTTIDPDMQRIAEEVMVDHMKGLQSELKNEWSRWKLDPWTYKSNSDKEISVAYRASTLNRLIRETERYQGIRISFLTEITTQLEKEYEEINFHDDDREIVRMFLDQKNPDTLNRMVARGWVTQNQAAVYRDIMKSEYFPQLMDRWKAFQARVKTEFETPVDMRVFTYENEQMEKDTLMSPLDSIKYHRFFLQTGILAVEPTTGNIKVWVGGINHKYFQYDHIRTNRQVGSTFKPFIYATAIERQGFSPCYKVPDWAQTISPGDGSFHLLEDWTPENFTGEYTGEMFTLKEGLRKSINTISVYLMKQIGDVAPVLGLVHNMGIDTSMRYSNGRFRVPRTPSICLGSTDLTVMQMTGAYSTFANNGIFNKPTHILRIEDKNGRVIFEEFPEERSALPPNANYVMVDMLRYSGTGLGRLKSDVGGKTGTTNDFVDGWFMGITPNLVVGTWVGGEDRWIHFRSPTRGQGSHMAKPFFREFIKRLEDTPEIEYDTESQFYRPPGDLGIELDCSVYHNAYPGFDPELDGGFEEDIFSEEMFGDEATQPRRDTTVQQ